MIDLLFTNAGRRSYLIEYALELKNNGYPLQIHVSDADIYTAAFYATNDINILLTPRVENSEEGYLTILWNYCSEKKVDLVVPLMDFEIPLLARNKAAFEEIGTRLVVSNYDLVMKMLWKDSTEKLCDELGVNYPRSYFSLTDFDGCYPVIQKRVCGSGSIGQEIVYEESGLYNFVAGRDFLQKYIPGDEYGLDIFNDFNGNYVHSCCKKKILMRSGETDKAEIVCSDKFEELARYISYKLRHIGNIDVDLIVDDKIYFIDFNPRFGGGYPFTHMAGCNYLKAILDLHMGIKPELPCKPKQLVGMKGIKIFSCTKEHTIEKEDLYHC